MLEEKCCLKSSELSGFMDCSWSSLYWMEWRTWMDLDVNLISVGCETHVELCVVSLMFGCWPLTVESCYFNSSSTFLFLPLRLKNPCFFVFIGWPWLGQAIIHFPHLHTRPGMICNDLPMLKLIPVPLGDRLRTGIRWRALRGRQCWNWFLSLSVII